MKKGNSNFLKRTLLALTGLFFSLVTLGATLAGAFLGLNVPAEAVGATIASTTETITLGPGNGPNFDNLTKAFLVNFYYGADSVNAVEYYWDGVIKNPGADSLARLHVQHNGYIATNEPFADLYSVSFSFHTDSSSATDFRIYSNPTASTTWYDLTPVATTTVRDTSLHHSLTYYPYLQGDPNQYFAVGVKNNASLTVKAYVESITFTFHRLQSIAINDSLSTLTFASSQYQPSILAHYNVGADGDITSAATYNSRVYRNILGAQTLSVSYQGKSASKSYDVTNVGADASAFSASEQAAATRDYLQKYKTCPSGVSDATVLRLAKEYNAMIASAKPLFAALSETVNDYDYNSPNQYSSGTYTGGSPSVAGVSIYTKLLTMVQWYNKNHSSAPIYLYSDAYYAGTDGNGSGTKLMPVFINAAGQIVSASQGESALSLTLIIVASSGLFTLLAIGGIYLTSKKRRSGQIH
ncbi:MAG: hypothetical protein BWY98_00247 [Tenericutes bacterium ADurb.BinA155]|nr:MAG: hypothetical protein BWY98_00247 [Tenericutes bacterium ADurb.BinA155]